MPTPIEVRPSSRHGLGVFALRRIGRGGLIERCHVLLLEPAEAEVVAAGGLYGMMYDWPNGSSALALGFGSLYNHDPDPNAEYTAHEDGPELEIVARRDISAGEEITIDYTGGGQIELWFDLP
jgi:SET domain-containing protein